MLLNRSVAAVVLAMFCVSALGEAAPKTEAAGVEEQEAVCECECAKLNTEDAWPVGPGEFELEFAYSFSRAARQWGNHWNGLNRGLTQEHAFELGLTYGVTDGLDVGIGVGFADIYDRDDAAEYGRGFMDVSLGAKWQFYHDDDLQLSLAYLPAVTVPVGRRSNSDHIGASQEYWSLDQRVAMTKFWGRWTMNADVGYSLPLGEEADGARGTLDCNAAVGYQLCEWLQPEIEMNYAHEFVSGGDDADAIAQTPSPQQWG